MKAYDLKKNETRFDEMGLKPEILRAIDTLGFETPTPIQEKAIPEMLGGHADVIGLAQTGTGKTAAFGLPLIHLVNFDYPDPQGLILCPTRELCLQISEHLTQYARYFRKARIAAVYGGASISEQIRQIRKGAQIVVATPGRLMDLMKRRVIRLNGIGYAVLDEADEMLNMGFQEDIDEILRHTPAQKRTWLFSATMPPAAEKISENYMNDPVEITIGARNKNAENIAHTCYVVREKDRYHALKRIIDYSPDIFGLIFCRTRKETQSVAEKLMKEGYNAESLHGDLSQAQRSHIMQKFRDRTLQVLVATDVAARGLDVDDITHVIHYNMPDEPERYTHRSGRTARAGKSGHSALLVNTREVRKIGMIERHAGIRFKSDKIPEGRAICEKQLYALVDKMVRVDVNQEEIDPYLPPVYDALRELTKEDLIQRFVSAEFNRFLEYYRGAGDINVRPRKKAKSSPKPSPAESRPARKKRQRFVVSIGANQRKHPVQEGAIVRLVCDKAGISSDKLGSIHMRKEFAFFEVEQSVAGKVLKSLKGAKLDGQKIHARYVEKAHPEKNRRRNRKVHRKGSGSTKFF